MMRMDTFSTADINVATALLHEGGRLVGVDRSQPRVAFLFEDTPALRDVVRRYWSNELLCPAQSLLLAFKRAKHILHDYQSQP